VPEEHHDRKNDTTQNCIVSGFDLLKIASQIINFELKMCKELQKTGEEAFGMLNPFQILPTLFSLCRQNLNKT